MLTREEQRSKEIEVSNAVYSACIGLFESLEYTDIFGNGHHMAQLIAKKAEDELKSRWKDKLE